MRGAGGGGGGGDRRRLSRPQRGGRAGGGGGFRAAPGAVLKILIDKGVIYEASSPRAKRGGGGGPPLAGRRRWVPRVAVFPFSHVKLQGVSAPLIQNAIRHLQTDVTLVAERDREGDGFVAGFRGDEDGVRRAALGGRELIAALFRVQGRAVNRRRQNLCIICTFALEVKNGNPKGRC